MTHHQREELQKSVRHSEGTQGQMAREELCAGFSLWGIFFILQSIQLPMKQSSQMDQHAMEVNIGQAAALFFLYICSLSSLVVVKICILQAWLIYGSLISVCVCVSVRERGSALLTHH